MSDNIFSLRQYTKLVHFFDRICTPVISYRANSHLDKARALIKNLLRGRRPHKCLLQLFLMTVQISYATLMTPIAYALNKLGFRFLMVDLSQIGSLMWIDLYIREKQINNSKYRKIFVCRSEFPKANNYGIDLYEKYFTFVMNPFFKLFLQPFFVNLWFRDDTFNVQEPFIKGKMIGSQGSYGYQIHQKHFEKFKKPLIKICDEDSDKAWNLLSKHVFRAEKFVVLHARDPGFHKDYQRTTRNANIFDYEKGISYLIDNEYKVIRFGDKEMVPVGQFEKKFGSKFFDYAHSELKCELLDMFLVENCAFCITCASGVLSLPLIFNKPACFVNHYTATTCLGYLKGDLSIFKKFRYKSDGELVSFKKIMEPPLSENLQFAEIDKLGMYLEDNSPEEIYQVIKEFVEGFNRNESLRQVKAKKLIPKMRHSYGGAGNFGDAFLKLYFPEEK